MTLREAQHLVRQRLDGLADRQEQRFLLETLAGMRWATLLAHPETPLTTAQETRLDRWLDERVAGKPIQYVTGEWTFMGLPLCVREGVLIPRDDTETLARTALAIAKASSFRTALDLCCGSGCLGVALAKLGGLRVTCADLSDEAIALTRENLTRNGVQARVVQGDFLDALPDDDPFDLIVCNPPYIPTDGIDALDRNVRAFEPRLALDGGSDGLAFYRRLAADAPRFLCADGFLALEIGFDQGPAVARLFEGWPEGRVIPDLNGNDRVFVARNPTHPSPPLSHHRPEDTCSTNSKD